jgi:hypothetical protein
MRFLKYKINVPKVIRPLLMVLASISIASCSLASDNATKLGDDLQSAASELKDKEIGSEFVFNYEPKDPETPFTILIFPEKGVTYAELLDKGLDSLIVADLYPQLSYIDLKDNATSVVYQNGKISFSTFYKRFVDVTTAQIISGQGNINITVKSLGVGLGNLGDEVLLIELK